MERGDMYYLKQLPIPSSADIYPDGVPFDVRGQRAGLIGPLTLAQYVPPRVDKHGVPRCLGCGSALLGFLSGTFAWSLAWGEFHCSVCGYPGRYYHKLTADDGTEHVGEFLWQAHPDTLILPRA